MKSPVGSGALGIVRKYHPDVESVEDAKNPALIVVTADDCAKGRSKSPNSCALARAACREYDGAIISLSVAYLITGKKATRYRVPNSISREIVSFDRSERFEPGEYQLISIPKSGRLGPRQGPQPKGKANKYQRNKARSHRTAGVRAL